MKIKDSILKRILLALIPSLVLCFCNMGVIAVDDDEITSVTDREDKEEKSDKKEEEEKVNPKRKKGGKPALGDGETGILIDSKSGRVMFEKDSDKKMYPASTTKIMTALLAIEAVESGKLSMDTQIEVTKEMLEDLDPDGTNMALKEGEILTLENLLRGLMIASGNDAANVIAMYLGQSVASFVDLMNARALELGAEDTHFVNPHGLHDDEHYTTAADMAKIAREAMKHFEFRNIVDIAHVKIPPTNKTEQERYYINTNGLLSTMRYTNHFYKGSIGIKTGYTSKAGNCLVSAAKRENREFIGVIFGGENSSDSHNDSAEMLDWGFENYTAITAISKNTMTCEVRVRQGKRADSLPLSAAEAISVVVENGTSADELEIRPNIPESVRAPIFAGQEIGTVSVLHNGTELASGTLIASRDVERTIFWPIISLGEWLWAQKLVRVLVYLVIAAAVAFVLIFVIGIYNNLKKAKHRRRRMR